MPPTVYNIATTIARRIVPPPIPPYPTGYRIPVDEYRQQELNEGTRQIGAQFFPLGIKLANESDFWWFPQEPMVGISGSNVIVRRNIAKTGTKYDVRGTVKERWSQDDYRITINGMLKNVSDEMRYPEYDVQRLRSYCEAQQPVQVSSPLFEHFNITQIVIESFDIPFTRGENMQAFSINAFSDALFELLVDMENV